jgi:hypothetical protein
MEQPDKEIGIRHLGLVLLDGTAVEVSREAMH